MMNSNEIYQLCKPDDITPGMLDGSISAIRNALESQTEMAKRSGHAVDPNLSVIDKYIDEVENYFQAIREVKANGSSPPEYPSFPEMAPSHKSS